MSSQTTPQIHEKLRQRNQERQNKRKKQKKEAAKEANKQVSKAEQLFQGQLNPKKLKASKPVRLEQWIEIRIKDGVTTVERFPDNEGVIKQGQKMWPPPNMVYRRLNFADGIPHEYDWVGVADESHRKNGGCGIQRMSINTWLQVVEQEAKFPDGRVLPVPNLPRHRSNGECQCENCQRAYTVLERLEAEGKNIEDIIQARLATEYTGANLETEPGTK